ncbi:hypothetical protein K474DRAFT_1744807 [Panus rudis PR-1116 ss-1]|nr:hypothetical protein K474DRAFT_1744807 [Panus rudis PR-1116 ss-1]
MSRLSRRSYAGSMHERRVSRHRVSDEDLMNYVLRVALLSYKIQPKAVDTPSNEAESKERDYSARIQGAISNSIFSLGDLFSGSKGVRFPKDLLKTLEQKLQDIAMGKDPAYSDQLIRRTMAVFYGQVKDESFRRQMKENRKIEELILMFATNATNVLKKEPTLAGDGWKVELNNHISQFIRLLRDCLRHVSHVSPELTARLDMYTAKLAPSQSVYSDSGYDSSSTSRDRDSVGSSKRISMSVRDMPLVQTAAGLFKLPEVELQREIDELSKYCTEKAALNDLKTCLKNINAGAPFPGRREDFDSEAAWQHWRTLETSHLSQLMVVMVQFNPELAKSTPSDALPATATSSSGGRPGSVYSYASQRESYYATSRHASISSRNSITSAAFYSKNPDAAGEEVAGDDDLPVGHHFTYIPPNPRKYYKRLLEICIAADLEAMLSPAVGDDDEVSLGILSPSHIELINECALRWRIGQPYRAVCFLDIVKQFYERNEVPLECIPEALHTIGRVMHEIEFEKWPTQDCDYLAQVYGGLFSIFLSCLYHAMDALPNLKPTEIAPYLQILETVRDSGLLSRFDVDVTARIQDVQDQIRSVAARAYDEKNRELHSAPGVNRALPLLFMTDELEKWAKLLDKRFPEPLLGQLDVVSLVVEVQIPMFLQDLDASRKRLFEDSMNGPTPDVPIQDVFALYRRTKTLMGMYQAFVPNGDAEFDIAGFFEPYVQQWLTNTHEKTTQWVQAAIAADKFEAEGPEGHSSSIIDLFDSLRSPINFLDELEWSDEYQEAKFYTSLSKTISRAIEQYCRSVEELFMAEMFPRPTDFIQPQKSSAWLEKAKQLATTTGEKKLNPFNFRPESCVKLNNIQAARRLLDNMYAQMKADQKAEILATAAPPVPEKDVKPQRYLFTVKIAIAEGLVPLDSSPSTKLDTFVTLSDEQGHRLAKTRTIYETLSPRWDETFDLSVEKPLWLMVSVRDRALIGKHDTVGRAYICLDPRRYGDYLTHDQWMDLDTQGRILLRISMEGEKDDPQFYFGRAFRSLKRAEADMVRVFIDKISPFIRQSISRPVLKSLIKTNTSIDYNKAIGNVTALYRSALGGSNDVQIPLPSSEKPRVRPEELTDVEIEQALTPLFDFFDANLPTLNTYLSDSAKEMVMTRVWKEILNVIEGLLIPPLSNIESDMKPLTDKEVDIAFKWLKFLRDYFYAGGEGPIPLETLQNQKYRDVLSIRLYYDWHTDALMEECVRMMQQSLRASPSVKKRAKSVKFQRNLGTIKDRKREKQQEKEGSNGETILRILRMRPGTSDFIAQQLHAMTSLQAEREAQAQEAQKRKLARPSRQQQQHQSIPEVPEIPPVPPLPSKDS